jgi:hypothetical protein
MTTEPVADRTPMQVTIACIAIVLAGVLACFVWKEAATTPLSPRQLVPIAIATGLIVFGLLKRANWLRVLVVSLYLVGAVLVFIAWAQRGFESVSLLVDAQTAAQLTAAILLAQPASSAWFRR